MATITATSTGGTRAWSDTATWDTAAVPTAADEVVLNASSGPVTIAANAVCRSLNASAYVGTLTHNAAVSLTIGDAIAATGNAGLTLGTGMTYVLGNTTTSTVVLASTNTTQQTITTAGKTLGALTINGVGGSWLFSDDFTCNGNVVITAGAVTTNNKTFTCGAFQMNGATVVVTCGTSTFNLTGTTTGLNLFLRTSGATFTMGVATINIVSASANNRQFAAQASATSQATVNYTVAGSTGQLTVFPPFDVATLNFSDASNARTLVFNSGSTYTIRNTFNVQGTAGNPISITSNTAGSTATLSKPSRVVSCDYLSLKDITATGGASWYAGANSTIVSNVTGWFMTPPTNWQFFELS